MMNALLGMASFTYYINRPAYCNMSISYLQAIILIGINCEILLQVSQDEIGEKKKVNIGIERGIGEISFAILLALSLGTLMYTGHNMMKKSETSRKIKDLMQMTQPIISEVPDGTIAFGQGVHFIYGLYGRDTRCATIDFEDMNADALSYISELLEKENGFFAKKIITNAHIR